MPEPSGDVGTAGTHKMGHGGVWYHSGCARMGGPGWARERGQHEPHQVQQVPTLAPGDEQAQAPAQVGATLLESSLAKKVLPGSSMSCLLGRGSVPLAKGGTGMY